MDAGKEGEKNAKPAVVAAGPRYVLLATSAAPKVAEYTRLLARYGVQVRQVAPEMFTDEAAVAAAMVDIKCVSVLRDQAALLKEDGTMASLTETGLAYSKVKLDAILRKGKPSYEASTKGIVDPSRRKTDGGEEVFGWDDIFVVWNSGRTYQEMKRQDAKISSRDSVISSFIRDRLHYKTREDLAHLPQHASETIDFNIDGPVLVRGMEYLGASLDPECLYGNLLVHVFNQGLMFRSPLTRREKNYWLPGLNAGLPLVPKDDAAHEATFMAHDLGHFLQPDLIFTGSEFDKTLLGKQVYTAYRMMSEAITMMLADVLLVHHLDHCGRFNYPWAKRKIYPLFTASNLTLDGPDRVANLETMLRANVNWMLRGDSAQWKALHDQKGDGAEGVEARKIFENKYMPFFVSDYNWTIKNYDMMQGRAPAFAAWWADVEPLRHLVPDLFMETLEEFTKRAGITPGCDVVEKVFDVCWNQIYKPALLTRAEILPTGQRLYRAFLRYSIGQHAIFSAFTARSMQAEPVSHAIKAFLQTHAASGSVEMAEVERVRALYASFVHALEDQNLITTDDAVVYSEVYPLFEPYYVTYDEDPSVYGSVRPTYEKLFVNAQQA